MYKVEKENLVVRQFCNEDKENFYNEICINEEFATIFPLFKMDLENSNKFIDGCVKNYEDINLPEAIFVLGVFDKENNIIGTCGFEYNSETRSVEIFFGLTEANRGKKYSVNMLDSMCEISKEIGINKIFANVSATDEKVNKALEKSLFKFKRTFLVGVADMTFEVNNYMYN